MDCAFETMCKWISSNDLDEKGDQVSEAKRKHYYDDWKSTACGTILIIIQI